MNYIGRALTNIRDFYNDINPATLTGAIDVVVVEQPNGSYLSSPFHVRFGKIGVLRSREKMVDIEVNGEPIDLHMKLGESGEAFFVEEVEEDEEEIPSHLATSPLLPVPDLEKEIKMLHQSENPEVSIGVQTEDQSIKAGEEGMNDMRASPQPHSSLIPNGSIPAASSKLKGSSEEPKVKKWRRKKISKNRSKSLAEHLHPQDFPSALMSSSIEPEIFQMDEDFAGESNDEDDEAESSGIIRSSSLPITYEGLWDHCTPAELHPFSDGELSPLGYRSPLEGVSRPPSPKSDSEVEMTHKLDATSQTEQVSWNWGELPTLLNDSSSPNHQKPNREPLSDEEDTPSKKDETKRSMLGGMLNFMRYNRKMQQQQQHQQQQQQQNHQQNDDGIFLDNLEDLEPERAALYFPKYRSQTPSALKDEDAESGNGPSLPQSPHSQCLESDPEDSIKPSQNWSNIGGNYGDLAFSLCGGLQDSEEQLSPSRFHQFRVSFEDFASNPTTILQNPKLVVRMDGKFYNWQTSAPILMSLAVFNKSLPETAIAKLINDHMPKKKKNYSWWPYWGSRTEAKQSPKQEQQPAEVSLKVSSQPATPPSQEEEDKISPCPPTEPTEIKDCSPSVSSNAELLIQELNKLDINKRTLHHKDKYRKTLRLTSQQLANLKLRPGSNEMVFSVTTAYQGTTRASCHVYLWHHKDRVVISDIDGTITKSDVLGHILPILGRDWAHSGVARLFSRIHANGYHFLYLSARAIGQAQHTREYLRGIRQGDLCLPDGPLLLNPTSLLNAIHREVIEKKPEEFKINCLRDVQALFPKNPFHAGFGNKVNDTWAYCAVSVPVSRIFTINHHGDLRLALMHTYHSSYTSLSDVVDQVFPPYKTRQSTVSDFANSDEYSSFTYWRIPPPDIDTSLLPPPPMSASPTTTVSKK